MTTASDPTRPEGRSDGVEMTLSEERLTPFVQRVPVARAVLRKRVVVEQRTITVEVRHEEATMDVLPIDEQDHVVAGAHMALPEMVLHEEQIVVTRRIVPVERVRLAVDAVAGEQRVSADVRRERLEVDGDVRSA